MSYVDGFLLAIPKKRLTQPFDMNRMAYGGFKTIVEL